MKSRPTVLVLGGGPDAERAVSLRSAQAVADAIERLGRYDVHHAQIDRLDAAALRALPGDVIFPVLHGPWGEGGPLQDLLHADRRPYVGCGPVAARVAMDKLATKLAAWSVGVPTAPAAVLNALDTESPVGLPAVIKPVHEGSSVGLHVCKDRPAWQRGLADAAAALRERGRVSMVERFLPGRELTVGVLGQIGPDSAPGTGGALRALPIVEILPADGTYDYQAKYERTDTRYVVSPDLPGGPTGALSASIRTMAERVAGAIGVRHLARVDFILTTGGEPMLLEVNTMPGFTATSLLPKAAAAVGLGFEDLCARLVELALHDAAV